MSLPLVGISSCLMGNSVRYDGKHKFNQTVADFIEPHVQLLPICPESMAGLGIPRPPVNLIQTPHGIQAQGRDDRSIIVTDKLIQMANVIANSYPTLSGFICQSRSPSCGFGTTPILDEQHENVVATGDGLFINTLKTRMPSLIIINESELDAKSANVFLDTIRQAQKQI